MVLRAYSKWKIICSGKSTKIGYKQKNNQKETSESLGYLNQDSPHPAPQIPAQWYSTPGECSQGHRVRFPHRCQPEGYLPRKGRACTFLILSPAACCWSEVPGKCSQEVGAPFFLRRPHSWKEGSTLCVLHHWKYFGPNHPSWIVRCWFHTGRGK